MKYLFALIFLFAFVPVFAESHPEYSGINNPSFYELQIDEHDFSIPYQVDAMVIAMAVDKELNSFLIGLDGTKDSVMIVDLNHKLISAKNNEFAVLVNGLEVNYEIVSDSDSSTLSFFVPDYTEEVEIIGTRVIPEFPVGVIVVFGVIVSSSIVASKFQRSFFKL